MYSPAAEVIYSFVKGSPLILKNRACVESTVDGYLLVLGLVLPIEKSVTISLDGTELSIACMQTDAHGIFGTQVVLRLCETKNYRLWRCLINVVASISNICALCFIYRTRCGIWLTKTDGGLHR